MGQPIKILHIDSNWQITYFNYRPGISIRSAVPLQTAIMLLKTEDFDLILSQPHNKAILKKPPHFGETKLSTAGDQLFMEADHGDLREVWSNRYP